MLAAACQTAHSFVYDEHLARVGFEIFPAAFIRLQVREVKGRDDKGKEEEERSLSPRGDVLCLEQADEDRLGSRSPQSHVDPLPGRRSFYPPSLTPKSWVFFHHGHQRAFSSAM